jgi:hypothetical protein
MLQSIVFSLSRKTALIYILGLILLSVLFLYPRVPHTSIPATNSEVREGYTAYSIIKTGRDTNGSFLPILFRADNNYLSTLGVYIKIPGILLFGLNSTGIRSFGIVIGVMSLLAFYLFASLFFKNKYLVLLSTSIFALSPILLQANVLNLGISLALMFSLFASYFLFRRKYKLYWLAFLLAALSDFASIPFLLIVYILQLNKEGRKKGIAVISVCLLILVALIFKFDKSLFGYLKTNTVIADWLPQAYTYQIDKRISFEKIYGSVLLTPKFNFNRIAFNKVFFGVNSVFTSFIGPFNFEKISSPFQSQTVLASDGGNLRFFPQFYFWELPLIVCGIILTLKKNKKVLWLFSAAVVSSIIFSVGFTFFLPACVIAETYVICFLIDKFDLVKNRYMITFLLLFWIVNYLTIADIFLNNSNLWMPENDIRQSEIWNFVNLSGQKWPAIQVTDRLGEPLFYYLYYMRIDPGYFLQNKVNGPLLNGQTQRVDSVGSVAFGSFDYQKIDHIPGSLWIGLAGEFIGENADPTTHLSVDNGTILNKIKGVDTPDKKTFSEELWFVKSNLK